MLVLARSNAIDNRVELQRLIDREKTIMAMHPMKLVLAHDFFSAVKTPQNNKPHQIFAHIFGEHGQVIGKNLSSLVRAKKARGALISFEDIKGNSRRDVIKTATDYIDERIALAKKVGGSVEMFDRYSHPDFDDISEKEFSPEGRQKRIDEFTAIFNKTAYRLNDFVTAMDINYFAGFRFSGRVSRYQNTSFSNNEGHEVLQLWGRLNDLTDYSHLIEDDINQKGKKKPVSIFAGIRQVVSGVSPTPVFSFTPTRR